MIGKLSLDNHMEFEVSDKEGFTRGLTEANPHTWVIVPML
jgi:hypothetical protein